MKKAININKSIYLIFIPIILLSCATKQKIEPEPPEKLFAKYQESVVLIKNEYYIQLNLSNGVVMFLADLKGTEQQDLVLERSKAIENPFTIYGTGFFISENGEIATNRHIAFPEISDEIILGNLKQRFDRIKTYISNKIDAVNDTLTLIQNFYENQNNREELTIFEIRKLEEIYSKLIYKREEMEGLISALDFDPTKSNIQIKPVSVGIAYNNTFINNKYDFKECAVIKKSNERKIDLAVLQLNDKTTPNNITALFDFNDHNPNIKNNTIDPGEEYNIDKPLTINYKVYMIGFNYGLEMANTSNGIKAQFTQGTISQESDEHKVLYSIPALQGSSGSPIIDQWGNLIAINYAGITTSQSFNYGILAKHLKELVSLNNTLLSHKHDATVESFHEPHLPARSLNFENTIRNFLDAERRRDLDEISSYFARNVRRYWDTDYPSKEDVRDMYRHSWKITENSYNQIIDIVKIDAYTYDLYTIFKYTTRNHEYKETNSKVRFLFDQDGKIMETYGM